MPDLDLGIATLPQRALDRAYALCGAEPERFVEDNPAVQGKAFIKNWRRRRDSN